MLHPPEYLDGPNGGRLAYHKLEGNGPTVVFLTGFKSDMDGSKAIALEDFCREQGRAFVRFDFSGHGRSEGAFEDGTIGRWFLDAVAVLDNLIAGPVVLVGSSMGGWVALLLATHRSDIVKAMVLIAPAPDFTEKLMWDDFSDAQKKAVMEDGQVELPSDYDAPYIITRDLIVEGRSHQLLDGPISYDGPVRMLHGLQDKSVPPHWSQKISDALTSTDVEITYVKAGDHSLSNDADLDRLRRTLKQVLAAI